MICQSSSRQSISPPGLPSEDIKQLVRVESYIVTLEDNYDESVSQNVILDYIEWKSWRHFIGAGI